MKGFTLIELLVVVLIIGILAAVVLPQYRVAVEKSRMAQQIALVDAVVRGQELYYMANGQFADDVAALDISLPAGCTFPQASDRTWASCGSYSVNYKHAGNGCLVVGTNDGWWEKGSLRYQKNINAGPCTGGHFCNAETTNSTAQQVCKSFGGINPSGSIFGGFTRYTLP